MLSVYPSCLYMYVSIYIRRARVYSTQTGFSIDIIVCAFVSQSSAIGNIINHRLDVLRGFGPKFLSTMMAIFIFLDS